MAKPARLDEWVQTAIAKQMASVGAVGWDDATQLRFLRLLVEQGLDELEACENEYFDFMAQCAVLASENMQDARLQLLEHRVGALENPPFDLAQTLIEGALIMVGEVVIAAGAFYAVPALFSVIASRKMARVGRDLAAEARRVSGAVARIEQDLAAKVLQERTLRGKGRGAITVQNWAEALTTRQAVLDLNRAIALDRDKLRLMEAALQTSEAAAQRAAAAFDAVHGAADSVPGISANLRKLLHNDVTGTVIGRLGETTGQDISAISLGLLAEPSDAPFVPFESSGIVSQFLAALQSERRASRQEWGERRLQTRFVDDAKYFDSPSVQAAFALIAASRFETNTIVKFSSEERSVFILGFEALLWRHWFAYSNLLYLIPFEERDPERVHHVGEVFDGRLVKAQDLGDLDDGVGYGFVISGDSYPGAASLNEGLAKVLFNKFAAPYFKRYPEAVPSPMKALDDEKRFNQVRYDELWRMSESIFNDERGARLDEVRVLVVVYFMRTAQAAEAGDEGEAAGEIRKAIREMLELPSGEAPLQQILEGLPTFPVPGAPPLAQEPPASLASLASALASSGGLEQKWLTGDARSQLEAAVAYLDTKIATYPLRFPSPAATSADRVAADDAAREIEAEQQRVGTRYETFLELAADDAAVVADVQAQLAERIRTLTSWEPGQVPEGTWQFYPAEEELPPVS